MLRRPCCLRDPSQPPQIVGLKHDLFIGVHIQGRAVPVGVDVAVLLDEDVVEDVVGDAAHRVRLHDGGVRQRLVVCQLHSLVVEMEAAAHPAAVQSRVPGHLLQILEDFVPLLLVEVLRCGGGVVEPELNGGGRELAEPLHIGHQLLGGIVLVQHAVHPEGHRKLGQQGVVVLDNGKSLMLALSQDLSQNRPAEAREHVRRFHELFFTLSPEKSAIEHNVKRALLLADKSVYHYYSDFAEKGYYNRIIAGNINQVLKVDSVVCDFNAYPYRAVTYATQKIIRQSNVTERSLVTTCRLLNASRSDDNPNGFTIEGFTIIENKDLQTIKR